MKIKLVFLTLMLSLLAFGFAFGEGADAARSLQVQSEVNKPSTLSISRDNINHDENVIVNDQTITLKNPTFEEVKDFILKDPTSRNTFILNEYECRHFATDVNNNADAAGLRCAFVLLCYKNGQHAVVAFDTTDRGMIFIEPQTDAAIQPEVGGTYEGQEIIEILIGW